jgi:hypothetical protein
MSMLMLMSPLNIRQIVWHIHLLIRTRKGWATAAIHATRISDRRRTLRIFDFAGAFAHR